MHRGGYVGLGICLLAVAGFGGAATYMQVAAAAGHFNRTGAHVGGALMGSFALAFAALAVWLWRRRHHHPPSYLTIDLDRDELVRGEKVTATLAISDASKVAGKLQLGLVCDEFYDYERVTTNQNGGTTRSRVTTKVAAHEQWHGADPTSPQESVAFAVPTDGPFSYEGTCVSYAWRVSARIQREHRGDPYVDRPLWVAP